MKLRTTFTERKAIGGNLDDFEHDAMAAHALMQAVSEAKNKWFITQSDHSHWIEEHADELMREWFGRDEGEL